MWEGAESTLFAFPARAKLFPAYRLTPELSRPDLRRRTAADYQKPQADAAKRGRLERLVRPHAWALVVYSRLPQRQLGGSPFMSMIVINAPMRTPM